MKLKNIVALMLLAALTLPAMAQKKEGKQESPKTQPKEKAVTPDHFEGTICFELSMQAPVVAPKSKSGAVDLKAMPAAVAPAMGKEKVQGHYSLKGPNCTGLLGDLYYVLWLKEDRAVEGLAPEPGHYRAWNHKFCQMKPMGCEVLNKVKELQKQGQHEAAAKMLEPYYIRTTEKKEVCGIEVTRYNCANGKASFWVAEGITIDSWFAPFWGINHPVLEFDLPIAVEGCEDVLIHWQAVKMIKGEYKDMADELKGLSEEMSEEEYRDNLRMVVDRYRR